MTICKPHRGKHLFTGKESIKKSQTGSTTLCPLFFLSFLSSFCNFAFTLDFVLSLNLWTSIHFPGSLCKSFSISVSLLLIQTLSEPISSSALFIYSIYVNAYGFSAGSEISLRNFLAVSAQNKIGVLEWHFGWKWVLNVVLHEHTTDISSSRTY